MLNGCNPISILLTVVIVLGQASAQESVEQQVRDFEEKYSLELVLSDYSFRPDQDGISGEDSSKTAQYLPLLFAEFGLYPPDFVRETGVTQIVLCKHLAYQKQRRAAIPGLRTGILYFDVERGAGHPMYQRSVIHHEYFHLIDYRDDGKLYVDKQWASLNPGDFQYGNGGAQVQDDLSQGLTFDQPGFMNRYSTQGVEEDKAEIFAYLITESALMAKRVVKDPVVAAKVKMMKQLMASFSQSIDQEFWTRATRIERGGSRRSLDDFLQSKGVTVAKMSRQAELLMESVNSGIGKSFLAAARDLPEIEPFELYYAFPPNTKPRPIGGIEGISRQQWESLDEEDQTKYTRLEILESNYYFTNYGSPILFVRALDLVGEAGLNQLSGRKVVDFGFGSIGQLRMMAAGCGADVTGIDVDLSLKGIYARPSDQGVVPSINPKAADGSLSLHFGRFPANRAVAEKIGSGIDLFIAKNTLKRGYIHPAQAVDANRAIDLGVDDEEFVRAVYERLNPGGFFMIYNFHPQRTPAGENYIPWSDGRSPFSKAVFEMAGFKIIQMDCDDTAMAHQIARKLGLDKSIDLESGFRATYTLLKK